MMEAVLTVLMPESWVRGITDKYDTKVRILDCVPCGQGGGRSLFEMDIEDEDIERVEKDIMTHPDVDKVRLVRSGEGKVRGTLFAKRCSACRTISESDCFLRSAITLPDGRLEWTVVSGSDGALARLRSSLEERGCKVEVVKLTRLAEDHSITKRQHEIVQMAFELGYFDYPKRVTVRELAKRFQIAPSTMGEILQRAERNIIEQYIKEPR